MYATTTATESFTFRVVKGCRDLDIAKGKSGSAHLDRVLLADDVSIRFTPVRTLANGRWLWMSGNRKNLPTLVAGQIINLNDGNPRRTVKVEVVSIP